MLVRTTFVAATAALALSLLGGTAQASCLDDFQAGLDDGYAPSPKSQYWGGFGFDRYVVHSGTADVTLHGDALLADQVSLWTVDWPALLLTIGGNAPDSSATFVDCVAG